MPPKKTLSLTDIWFVGERWRVDRQERDVVTARDQLGRQRVVAQTTAAIHLPGAACEIKNFHY